MTSRRDSPAETGTTGLASFRELKGVGPAKEAKLHRAGVYTWEALAEIVDALGGATGRSGDRLHELSDQLTGWVTAAGSSPVAGRPGEERHEAFVLRLSLTVGGRPLHSTVTHVRSQLELPLVGWSAEQAGRFIEERAGVAEASLSSRPAQSTAARAVPERPVPQPAAPVRDHVVVLEAGKAIGGARRTIEFTVGTADAVRAGEFEFRAELAGRPYGAAADSAPTPLAQLAGEAQPPAPLALKFPAVDLPAGLHRLRLRLAVRLAEVGPVGPILSLAQSDG